MPSGVEGEANIGQFTHFVRFETAPWTEVMLVVVDDAPTDEARALREFLATDIAGSYERAPCGEARDKAKWRPADVRVVLVSPSDPARTLTSETNPELLLRTPNATEEELVAWETAVGDAILASETPDTESFRGVEALEHWARLLTGYDGPASDVERRFMASLPSGASRDGAYAFVGTTRDDESPAADGERWIPLAYAQGLDFRALPETCSAQTEAPAEFETLDAYWTSGPCEGATLFDYDLSHECTPDCLDVMPLVDDGGRAECRVLARSWDLADCPEWAGWADPEDGNGERSPRFEDAESGTLRVCEVLQLEGDALDSCRTDLACEECGAGYCFAASSLYAGECRTWSDFRFTLGSDTVRSAEFEITCNMAE